MSLSKLRHSQRDRYIHAYTNTHTLSYANIYMHTHILTSTFTYTYIYIHTLIHIHAHINSHHSHTLTHSYTHTDTCTHTHTRMAVWDRPPNAGVSPGCKPGHPALSLLLFHSLLKPDSGEAPVCLRFCSQKSRRGESWNSGQVNQRQSCLLSTGDLDVTCKFSLREKVSCLQGSGC